MLALYKNGKFYDYGTRNHVSFYIRLGYTVKVMDEREAEEFVYQRKVKHVWDKLPTALKKRVAFMLRKEDLTWAQKYNHMMNILDTIAKRAAKIEVVHHVQEKEWTIKEQLVGVYNDICYAFATLKRWMTPMNAAQYQLAY